jgi:hypothetical protein
MPLSFSPRTRTAAANLLRHTDGHSDHRSLEGAGELATGGHGLDGEPGRERLGSAAGRSVQEEGEKRVAPQELAQPAPISTSWGG